MLRTLSPVLLAGEFVFCSFEHARYGDYIEFEPIASFVEQEGLTLILPRSKADQHKLSYDSSFACITLQIHSSLTAIGLTAALSQKLTERRISANVVAGFYHDHVFVQASLAEEAIAAINELAKVNL